MSDSRAQTGVRSLLARFENNNNNNSSTSPPSRGRSPIDHDRPGSVRPLSKVRASFVAVERAGQPGSPPMWGLRKAMDLDNNNTNTNNSSTNNSPGKLTRTMSSCVDDVGSPIERSVTMSSSDSADKGAMMGRSLASSPPDNNMNNNNANNNSNGGLLGSGSINRPWAATLPSRLVDSPTPGKQSTSRDILTTTTTTEGKELGKPESKGDLQNDTPQAKEGTPIATPRMNGKSTDKTAPKNSKASINSSSRPAKLLVGNAANNTTSKNSSIKDMKPPLPRTPRTPTTIIANPGAKTTPKEADRPRAAATKQTTRTAADKPTGKLQSSAPTRDKMTLSSSENPSGNNRSRTRSPTKPIRLPNSMIAPTASSAAKTNLDGRPVSQAGTRTSTLTRKPSSLRSDRNTASSRSTGPAASATQKRPARASSLAPNTAHDRPRSRVSNVGATRPPDESFLARMMRPTASSASKVHEKAEIKSPPRGSGPSKVRRKSGESASSNVSGSVTARTPPSSKKKSVANSARTVSSNGDVEPRKEPELDGAQVQAQTEITPAAAAEVEIAFQEPESQPTLEPELEPEPKSEPEPEPAVAEPEPAATEPTPEPEPQPALSEPTVSEPSTVLEPVVSEASPKPESEPQPAVSEPTVPEPSAAEPADDSLPEIAEVSIVEEDPAKVPLPEPTEKVEL